MIGKQYDIIHVVLTVPGNCLWNMGTGTMWRCTCSHSCVRNVLTSISLHVEINIVNMFEFTEHCPSNQRENETEWSYDSKV